MIGLRHLEHASASKTVLEGKCYAISVLVSDTRRALEPLPNAYRSPVLEQPEEAVMNQALGS